MKWGVVVTNFFYLARGLEVTAGIGLTVMLTGTILGFLVGFMRISRMWLLRTVSLMFVELFRDTPLILQIFFVFFGLPALGIRLNSLLAASLAMTFFAAANAAEIVRGAIQSIPHGQVEAARSLALTWWQTMSLVILPQALRRMVPPFMGLFTTLIKDTSLAAIIGVFELTRAGREVVERTLASFEIWITVAAIYFLICYPLSLLTQRLEQRLTAEAGH
ncbi:MAG: amino acid ABC transporter permease [Armatimonadota bacterium]|nr:amino acid ABC transporter permease [Armatimonadota bacterium]